MIKKTKHSHGFHLRPRTILEIVGLTALIVFVIQQWEVIDQSFFSITNSDLKYLSIAFFVYWLFFPLGSFSYRLLSQKKIKTSQMMLAQLAGNGPGRIIPGGLGNMSFSVLYIRNTGIQLKKAIVIGVANNLTGIIINTSLFAVILLFKPEIREVLNNSLNLSSVALIMLIILSVLVSAVWISRLVKVRAYLKNLYKQWRFLLRFLNSDKKRIVGVIIISLSIISVNSSIIYLCAKSVGVDLTIANTVIALSIGVMIGGLLPTPGGLGGVEAGIASTLVVLGYGAPEATSIALLFRTITYWQPLLPGTISYFYMRERKLL